MNFISKMFKQKKEYIGLSSFNNEDTKKPVIKKEAVQSLEKTTLTGLIKRAI